MANFEDIINSKRYKIITGNISVGRGVRGEKGEKGDTPDITPFREDYESLKKVIIDENASANLQEQINYNLKEIENITTQLNPNTYYPGGKGCSIWVTPTTPTKNIDEYYVQMNKCGLNSVYIICWNTVVDNGSSITITRDLPEEKIQYCIDQAKANGINDICLKLHIYNSLNYKPYDYDVFLDNWKPIVDYYKDLSVNNGLSELIIANEMKYIAGFSFDKWKEISDSVKASGLKVSANFSGIEDFYNCCFKDELDVIGINYYPVIQYYENETITQELCNERFYTVVCRMEKLRKDYPNKKIVISEIGCSNNKHGLMITSSNSNFPTDETSDKVHEMYVDSVFGLLGGVKGLVDNIYWFCFDKGNVQFGFANNDKAVENCLKYKVGGVM